MIDPVWEKKYAQGYMQRYPWDSVVSFIYRYAPKNVEPSAVKVLEVGFGSGANLWFAAREGFSVAGVEASRSAVLYAKKRFLTEGLEGDLRQGDFVSLPFDSNSFDLVIDRAALTHVGKPNHEQSIKEIHRVLKVGGFFHYNTYADTHSSNSSGEPSLDNVKTNITSGSLQGVGQVLFVSKNDVDNFFAGGWKAHSLLRREWVDTLSSTKAVHSDWLAIMTKVL